MRKMEDREGSKTHKHITRERERERERERDRTERRRVQFNVRQKTGQLTAVTLEGQLASQLLYLCSKIAFTLILFMHNTSRFYNAILNIGIKDFK